MEPSFVSARRTSRRTAEFGGLHRPLLLDDAQLVQQVQAGRTDAFGDLVRKYQDRVFNTCWRICGNLEDARDIAQDAFIKALEGLSNFRGESGFYTWLFRIAVNLALTHRRDAARRRTLSMESALAGTQAEELAGRIADPNPIGDGEEKDRTEMMSCVARALHNLDDEQRAVVVLRDMEGFDYVEIADILGVPPGTVKSRLHRARAALGEALRPAAARDE